MFPHDAFWFVNSIAGEEGNWRFCHKRRPTSSETTSALSSRKLRWLFVWVPISTISSYLMIPRKCDEVQIQIIITYTRIKTGPIPVKHGVVHSKSFIILHPNRKSIVGLERGPLSLVSITEELLERNSSCSGSRESRLTAVGIRCADHVTASSSRSWH
jgi:hypothetical protein